MPMRKPAGLALKKRYWLFRNTVCKFGAHLFYVLEQDSTKKLSQCKFCKMKMLEENGSKIEWF